MVGYTPLGVGLETPQVWVWRLLQGVGLENPPRYGPGDPSRCGPGDPPRDLKGMLGYQLQGMLGYHPPPCTEFLTHATENITLPQISFAGGKNANIANFVYFRKTPTDFQILFYLRTSFHLPVVCIRVYSYIQRHLCCLCTCVNNLQFQVRTRQYLQCGQWTLLQFIQFKSDVFML